MNNKKNSKLLLIVIIFIIILILLIGVSIAYFATDLFKGNKELFFKYVSNMVDEEEGFIDKQLISYFEKQKNTPYSDNGTISVNITSSEGQEQFENANNVNLTFSGQVDTANNIAEQNISLNYSDDVKFPLIYKQIEDTVGIQTDYIGSKYISTNSLLETLLSENTQLESLEQVQQLENTTFSSEELQHIKDTYFPIINKQLKSESFSKIENENSKGYRLTLKDEDLKNIVIAILETLKNDEYMQEQINSTNITTSDIDDLIEEINNSTGSNEQNIEITVYQSNGKTNRITIAIDSYELNIEKISSENEIQYSIEFKFNIDEQMTSIGFNAKFSGLQSMQNVSENYELSIGTDEIMYKYNYNNSIEFSSGTNIEEFNEDNSLLLEDLDEEQKNILTEAIVQRIQDVNKLQMEELGLEENQNPLQYMIPLFFMESSLRSQSNINDMEVATFNSKFENYESTNLQGVTVKGLLTVISMNNGLEDSEDDGLDAETLENATSDYLIEEIHFDGEEYKVTKENITLIKSSIETESYYRVEFEKDEDTGRIYRVVINKK